MNEPKRRGRPPKAGDGHIAVIREFVANSPKAKSCADCGQVAGHYDDCPVGLGLPSIGQAESYARAVALVETIGIMARVSPEAEKAQAYALRVWRGQSVSADRPWRVERVRLALEGQGLPFEGVRLPE